MSELALQLTSALAFGGAIALAMYWYRTRDGEPIAAQRMRRLSSNEPEGARRGLSWEDLRRGGASSLPVMRDFVLQSSWARRLELEIEQAGLRLHVGEYLLGRAGIALLAWLGVWAAGRSVPTFILGLALGVIGFMLPAVWLNGERRRRRELVAKQLPEAAQMVANALRAGFSFQHGIAIVAEQMEPPIAAEFARTNVDMNVGSSIEEALQGLLARVDTGEMNLMVTAVLVQRTAGGNLAEILEMVSDQIRERERLTGEMRTMTSQQRFSGLVLSIWPLLLLAGFSLLNWDQTSVLFTTNIGLVLMAAAAALQALGYVTIRRILDIEV